MVYIDNFKNITHSLNIQCKSYFVLKSDNISFDWCMWGIYESVLNIIHNYQHFTLIVQIVFFTNLIINGKNQ
jgi:hypothetical protein